MWVKLRPVLTQIRLARRRKRVGYGYMDRDCRAVHAKKLVLITRSNGARKALTLEL